MSSKIIWQGYLSFGLVNIPVTLYSAIRVHSPGFKLLHAKCKHPITYKKWCNYCGEEVKDTAAIIRGIELPNGDYFVMTDEQLRKIKPAKSDILEIFEFVDLAAIEPIYYEDHYFLTPKKSENKAYYLFIHALQKMNKVAIGRFAIKGKGHIAAIQPYKEELLLTTLHYIQEVRENSKIERSETVKVSAQELQLAETLVKHLTVKKLDLSKFKDTYAETILEQLTKKTKTVRPKGKTEQIRPSASLIDILRKSLKTPIPKSKSDSSPRAIAKPKD